MFPAAYRRVRTLMNEKAAAVPLARMLAPLEALLLLGLLAVGALLVSLCDTGGVYHTRAEAMDLPSWRSAPEGAVGEVAITDVGLYPLVVASRDDPNPIHRAWSRGLNRLLSRTRLLQNNLGTLQVLLATGLALLLSFAYARQWRMAIAADASSRAALALRNQIHRQVYRLGQSALPSEGAGPAVDLFTREVADVRNGLVADLKSTWAVPVLAGGLILLGLCVSWQITLFLVALAGLVMLISRPLARQTDLRVETAARDSAVQLCLLQEDLAMLRTVRVYGIENIDRQRFDDHLQHFHETEARRVGAESRGATTLLLVRGVSAILASGLLTFLVLTNRVSPAAATVLALVAIGLIRPLAEWIELRKSVRQAGRSAEAVFEFLERKPELQQAVGAQFLAPLRERISFENLSLDGPMGRTLLSGVSVEIPAKTRTAFLSLDESSKYAVACLIPRLIDPKVGRIRMDGMDLRDVTLESLRAQVAMVLQADLVFNDSVFNNIGLGDASYGLPRIMEAAKVAHAHHVIQDLPHGYDTPIGSLGHYLKPDEQYRIALARAFLHDPSIVVIEEPNVPLDDDTKHLIDDTIDRLAAGRTLIFLPHRLSTIRRCNQVVVLHNGRVEAAGSPREVHGQSKLYRHIQYVEFNQFATGEIEAGQMG